MKKRLTAGLLAFTIAFTAMDFSGFGGIMANAAGLVQVTEENQSNFILNGDYTGYYTIADKEDLQAFAAKVNAGENDINAVLTADIDMTGEDWTPIGDANDGYTGIFDGNGHKISNLVCSRTGSGENAGLITTLKQGTVKNLGIEGGEFVSKNKSAGAIAAYNTGGTIQNCWNTANVTANNQAGGIAGYSTGWIEFCKNSGNIRTTWAFGRGGGIAGQQQCFMISSNPYTYEQTQVKYCCNTGKINAGNAGGIIGYLVGNSAGSSDVLNCWSDAEISGSKNAGGIAGLIDASLAVVETCAYNSETFLGELYGENREDAKVSNSYAFSTEEFASGKVTFFLNGADNTLVGASKWFQNLEGNVDTYPVLDASHGKVYYHEDTDSYGNDPSGMESNVISMVSGEKVVQTTSSLVNPVSISLQKGNFFTWKGDTTIRIACYLDEQAQTPTTPENSGSLIEGGEPALPGNYYIKVTAAEVEGYYRETSKVFPYELKFDAGVKSVYDSVIANTYNGEPREISCEKGKKITWDCEEEVPTSAKVTYYADQNGTLTNAENSGAQTEGGAPAQKGTYYVKIELTFREKYTSISDYLPYQIVDGVILVTEGTEEERYASLEEAIDCIQGKTVTLKLLSRIYWDKQKDISFERGNFVLDLNGYRLSGDIERTLCIGKDAAMKITDSSESQNGTLNILVSIENNAVEFAGGHYLDIVKSENGARAKVSGGTFDRFIRNTMVLAEGFCLVDRETGEKQPYGKREYNKVRAEVCQEHSYEENMQYCSWCHKVNPDFKGYIKILEDGKEQYVNTVKEAFDYADGKKVEITLLKSMDILNDLYSLKNGSTVLNLNGKTLSASYKDAYPIYIEGADVTMKDGTVDAKIIQNSGRLTIENGDFKRMIYIANTEEVKLKGGYFGGITCENGGKLEDLLLQGYAILNREQGRWMTREEALQSCAENIEVINLEEIMQCETLPQLSGKAGQKLKDYTLTPGVVKEKGNDGEWIVLDGTWNFADASDLEETPKWNSEQTYRLVFTPTDTALPYLLVTVKPSVKKRVTVLKKGSNVKVRGTLTYGESLSELPFNTEGDDRAVFVEEGTENEISGTLAWKDGTQKPATGTASAAWVFTPDDDFSEPVEGIVAINVEKAVPDIGTVTSNTLENTLDISKVILSRSDKKLEGTLSLKKGTTLAYGTNDYSWIFRPDDSSNYKDLEGTVRITVKDTISPTAEYRIGTDGWKQFINQVTFGKFCKEYQTVEIRYEDNESGIETKQYYIADAKIKDLENLEDIDWKDYTEPVKLDAKGTYFVYIKAADQAGNTIIQNSEGVVIYEESSVVTANAERTYKDGEDLEIQLNLNGNTFAGLTDANGKIIGEENYTVSEKDAGKEEDIIKNNTILILKASYLDTLSKGEYTYHVSMNPQGIATDAVKLEYTFTVKVNAKELAVAKATADNKVYDGTNIVSIHDVILDGVAEGDEIGIAEIEAGNLRGTLRDVKAGDYTSVTLPELTLSGKDKENYILTQPESEVALTKAVNVAKSSGLQVEELNRSYLYLKDCEDRVDLSTMLPADCGKASYREPVTEGKMEYLAAPSVQNGILTYTVRKGKLDRTGTIKTTVTTENYDDFVITVNVRCNDQTPVHLKKGTKVTLKNGTLTYGESLSKLSLNTEGVDRAVFVEEGTENEISGTLAWKDGTQKPAAGTASAAWVFTPDDIQYASAEGVVTINVEKAVPDVKELPTVDNRIYDPSEVLKNADFKGGNVTGADGKELAGTWSWKNADIIPTVNNSGYEAVFTPEDTLNYKSIAKTIAVKVEKAIPNIGTVAVNTLENTLDISKAILSRSNKDLEGTLSLKEGTTLAYGTNDCSWIFRPADSSNYKDLEGTVRITVKDTISPTAEYQIGTDGWKKFINQVTFEKFCKEYQTVEIRYEDNESGIETKQYYITDAKIKDLENLEDIDWKDYTEPVKLDAKGTYFVYIKAADQAGNTIIQNSEGVVIYEESSVVTANAERTYKDGKDLEVQLKLNGNTFAGLTDANGKMIGEENYTVSEKDAAGKEEDIIKNNTILILKASYLDTLSKGEYTYHVSMNPQGIATDAVKLEYTFTVKVNAKELAVAKATADNKVYDGTNIVSIHDVILDGVAEGDEIGIAEIEAGNLRGTLRDVKAGDYTSVTLPELTLSGKDKENYILRQPETEVALTKAVNVAKSSGLQVEELNRSYLYLKDCEDRVDLSAMLPEDCGKASYGKPVTEGTMEYVEEPNVQNGILTYTVRKGKQDRMGTIKVNVTTENYADFVITVNVKCNAQTPIHLKEGTEVTLKNDTLTYGESLSQLLLNANGDDRAVFVEEGTENEISGTLAWKDGTQKPVVGTASAAWVFTPDDIQYATVEGIVAIKVEKAVPNIGTVTSNTLENTLDISKAILSRSDKKLEGTLSLKEGTTLAYGTNDCSWIFRPADSSNYKDLEGTVRITVKDTISPTAEYQIGTDGWKKFINQVTFGKFCKEYQTVEIRYEDNESGIETKQYYIADAAIKDLKNLADVSWKDYTEPVTLDAKGTYFVYIKAADKAGNTIIQNSEGVVIYEESSVVTTNSERTYKDGKDLGIQLNLNENTFAGLTDKNGKVIGAENYTVSEKDEGRGEDVTKNNTILTLKASYLDTLSAGKYTYYISMNPQGIVTDAVKLEYTFTVKVKAGELTERTEPVNPEPSDPNPITPADPTEPKPDTPENPSGEKYPAKGTKIKDASGNSYKVLCADGKTFTVAFLKPKKGTKGTVKIPGSIIVDEVTYKVTEIAANAFKNHKKIRKVVIPSGVNRIGKKAFYGCKNLKNITIKTAKLTKKNVGSKAFSGIHAKAVIKVPKKKRSAYKKILKALGVTKKEKVQALK